jgi:hypothetical protein
LEVSGRSGAVWGAAEMEMKMKIEDVEEERICW